MHAHVLIVLKKSLKWVPVGGWVSEDVCTVLRRSNDVKGYAILPLYIPREVLGCRQGCSDLESIHLGCSPYRMLLVARHA